MAGLSATLIFPFNASRAAESIVAKAGPIELNAQQVRSMVAALPDATRAALAADPKALEQYLRVELVRRAVADEVRTNGFAKQPDIAERLDRIQDEALLRLWIAEKAKPADGFPSEDVVRTAYESNKAAFAAPTEYRISQIFVSAPNGADAKELEVALRKAADLGTKIASTDFATLARSQSDHSESAAKGGDLGFLPENRLLPEVAAAVKPLNVGQTVGPVKTSQGLHFLKLMEKKAGAVPEYATIRDSIANALREKQSQQLEQAYLAELGGKLGISVNQIELAKLVPAPGR